MICITFCVLFVPGLLFHKNIFFLIFRGFFLYILDHIMPKLTAKATKKAESAEDMRAFGPIFNKDLGQHILKNPLVAQGIVDKVKRGTSLKSWSILTLNCRPTSLVLILYWKLVLVLVIWQFVFFQLVRKCMQLKWILVLQLNYKNVFTERKSYHYLEV